MECVAGEVKTNFPCIVINIREIMSLERSKCMHVVYKRIYQWCSLLHVNLSRLNPFVDKLGSIECIDSITE